MRVLLVGSDKIFAIENFYVKHLRAHGAELLHFPAQSLFYDYYGASIINKVLFRAGLSRILKEINSTLLSHVAEFKPDVVWIFKGMEIFPETLQEIKSQGCKLVNYNPDNPFIFSGRGSGNKNVTQSIGLYDLHFTYSDEIAAELLSRFKTRVEMLPFGFELSDVLYEQCQRQAEEKRICFLGNPDEDRAKFIKELAQGGLPVTVYGHGWQNFLANTSVEICDAVYGDEQWRILRRYRIQLNLMRVHNLQSHNMRTFEVPGVGGIMMAPDTPEHRRFFADGREAFLFKNLEHCAQQLQLILGVNENDAMTIRTAARKRALEIGSRYYDRAGRVVNVFKTLQNA